MMFLSFARNSSCVPLSCGLDLGFILAPQNKIARFRHSPCRNLAISQRKNQQQSHIKMQFYSIFNGGLSGFELRGRRVERSVFWCQTPKADRLKPVLLFIFVDGFQADDFEFLDPCGRLYFYFVADVSSEK